MANFKVTAHLYMHGVFSFCGDEAKHYIVRANSRSHASALVVKHLEYIKEQAVDCYMCIDQITSAYARQLRKRGYKSIKA